MEFYAYPLRQLVAISSSILSDLVEWVVSLNRNFAAFLILRRISSVAFTCCFALVGTVLGFMTGAFLGQETESGLVRGAAIGAISGAVFALEVFESFVALWRSEQSTIECLLYLIDVIGSLLSGRLVRERIGPAILSAVQSQMGEDESSYDELTSIFDIGTGAKAVSSDSLDKIPTMKITKDDTVDSSGDKVCCSVCLQDFQIGEAVRRLPHCRHMFHLACIDKWLLRHGSCPLCRRDL